MAESDPGLDGDGLDDGSSKDMDLGSPQKRACRHRFLPDPCRVRSTASPEKKPRDAREGSTATAVSAAAHFSRPSSAMVAFIRSRVFGVTGTSGRRISSVIMPISASAALAGAGLVSTKRFLKSG